MLHEVQRDCVKGRRQFHVSKDRHAAVPTFLANLSWHLCPPNSCLCGRDLRSPCRSLPSGQHLQNLEGQIRAEATSRHPHCLEEVRWTDASHRTRPATSGTTVLSPPCRQVLDQGVRSNNGPDRRMHPALASREHVSHEGFSAIARFSGRRSYLDTAWQADGFTRALHPLDRGKAAGFAGRRQHYVSKSPFAGGGAFCCRCVLVRIAAPASAATVPNGAAPRKSKRDLDQR